VDEDAGHDLVAPDADEQSPFEAALVDDAEPSVYAAEPTEDAHDADDAEPSADDFPGAVRGGTERSLSRRGGMGLIVGLVAGGAVLLWGLTTSGGVVQLQVGAGGTEPRTAEAGGSQSGAAAQPYDSAAGTGSGTGSSGSQGSAASGTPVATPTPAIGAPASATASPAAATSLPQGGTSTPVTPTTKPGATTTTTSAQRSTTTTTTTTVGSGGGSPPAGPGPIGAWYGAHQAGLNAIASDAAALSGAEAKYDSDASAPRVRDRKKKEAADLTVVVGDARTLAHDVASEAVWPRVPNVKIRSVLTTAMSALTQAASTFQAGAVTPAATNELSQGTDDMQAATWLLQFAQAFGV
jgi:hypothetical protein